MLAHNFSLCSLKSTFIINWNLIFIREKNKVIEFIYQLKRERRKKNNTKNFHPTQLIHEVDSNLLINASTHRWYDQFLFLLITSGTLRIGNNCTQLRCVHMCMCDAMFARRLKNGSFGILVVSFGDSAIGSRFVCLIVYHQNANYKRLF